MEEKVLTFSKPTHCANFGYLAINTNLMANLSSFTTTAQEFSIREFSKKKN